MQANNWTARERGVGDEEECSHNMMPQGCWRAAGVFNRLVHINKHSARHSADSNVLLLAG
jgi:hypothetical protein